MSLRRESTITAYWPALCVKLAQARVVRQEGSSFEEMSPLLFSCKAFFLLISYQWQRAQSTVGGAIPVLLALGSLTKQSEQATESKLVFSALKGLRISCCL